MDTVSDFCDHEIRPMVTENYDGGDLVLGTSGLVLSPKEFPHLTGLKMDVHCSLRMEQRFWEQMTKQELQRF